jgi:hypothetical protein
VQDRLLYWIGDTYVAATLSEEVAQAPHRMPTTTDGRTICFMTPPPHDRRRDLSRDLDVVCVREGP